MTIVEFLLARLAEDEAVARKASQGDWEVMSAARTASDGKDIFSEGSGVVAFCCESDGALTGEDAAHVARHDPQRVLAEIAAKRAIFYGGGDCSPFRDFALRALAQPYADHPEFDPAWRTEVTV